MPDNQGYMPQQIVAGESIWISADNTLQGMSDIVVSGYLPTTHTLAYQFAATTALTVSASANASNTGWTLEVTGAQTALWYAGVIRFAGFATETSTSRVTAVDIGAIIVTASPAIESQYQTILDAIDAAIEDYAANPFGSISMGGDVNITYRSLDQLLDLRRFYQAKVDRQTSGRQRRIIRTRFT